MTLHNPWALTFVVPLAVIASGITYQTWQARQDEAPAVAEVIKLTAQRDICGQYRSGRDTRHDCTRFTAHARYSVDGHNHVIGYPAGYTRGRNAPTSMARIKPGQRVAVVYQRGAPHVVRLAGTESAWGAPIAWWAAALFMLAAAVIPLRQPLYLQRFNERLSAAGRARLDAELARQASADHRQAAADQRRFEQD